jgi:hypothetical protein
VLATLIARSAGNVTANLAKPLAQPFCNQCRFGSTRRRARMIGSVLLTRTSSAQKSSDLAVAIWREDPGLWHTLTTQVSHRAFGQRKRWPDREEAHNSLGISIPLLSSAGHTKTVENQGIAAIRHRAMVIAPRYLQTCLTAFSGATPPMAHAA